MPDRSPGIPGGGIISPATPSPVAMPDKPPDACASCICARYPASCNACAATPEKVSRVQKRRGPGSRAPGQVEASSRVPSGGRTCSCPSLAPADPPGPSSRATPGGMSVRPFLTGCMIPARV
eukprot:scaffold92798_cov45-Phaeocystis_antarctica.AAC.1